MAQLLTTQLLIAFLLTTQLLIPYKTGASSDQLTVLRCPAQVIAI